MDKNTGYDKKYELGPLDTLERKKICCCICRCSEYNGSEIGDYCCGKCIDSPSSEKCIYT
jgi:hypothetical protein